MFSPKDPEEIITVSFDFAAVTATPSGAVVTASVSAGEADPDVADMVNGSPSIVGSVVKQRIIAGKSGRTYDIRCRVDAPDGSRYVLSDLLPVLSF